MNVASFGGFADFALALREGRPLSPEALRWLGVTDPSEFRGVLAAMPDEEKEDLAKTSEALSEFCRKPTRENAEAFLRLDHDRDMRTCTVWSNNWEQTFLTSDLGVTWVSTSGPAGDCGLVVISKFEKAKDEQSFWVYETRKIINNRETTILNTPCSSVYDERVIRYDWRSNDKFLNCDYIRFSVLPE